MAYKILGSWKEIAAYLGKGVRTAQRWEAELELPVRRPVEGNRKVVVALSAEIDSWLQSRLGVGRKSRMHRILIPQEYNVAGLAVANDGSPSPGWLVLVVDDNEVQRYTVSHILQYRGFRTLLAATGEEALRIAMEQTPDVVLSDIVLPDITGLDLCKRIHQYPKLGTTAVVFYSALTATDFESHGGDAFLTYPVSEQTLVSALETAIHRHTAEALPLSA